MQIFLLYFLIQFPPLGEARKGFPSSFFPSNQLLKLWNLYPSSFQYQ